MAPVVVAEVLIPQRQPEQALQGMLAAAGVAVIDEAGGQAPGQADALVDSLQQQGATIGGHAAAVKASAHLAAALIGQIDCDTSVCAWGVSLASS